MTADSTSDQALVVGVDFGTLSARAVVVRASDGAELGSGLGEYAHGSIERTRRRGIARTTAPEGHKVGDSGTHSPGGGAACLPQG